MARKVEEKVQGNWPKHDFLHLHFDTQLGQLCTGHIYASHYPLDALYFEKATLQAPEVSTMYDTIFESRVCLYAFTFHYALTTCSRSVELSA